MDVKKRIDRIGSRIGYAIIDQIEGEAIDPDEIMRDQLEALVRDLILYFKPSLAEAQAEYDTKVTDLIL